MIADLGMMLLSLGIEIEIGMQLALFLTFARIVSLSILIFGLNKIYDQNLEGPRQIKLSKFYLATIILGMCSLVGFPLTIGFPARWEVFHKLASIDQLQWFVSLCSMGLLWITVLLRVGGIMAKIQEFQKELLHWMEQSYLIITAGVLILAGVYPKVIFPWLMAVVEGIAN
jgi:formate hydrogenlyase subunit 3/multisubunit Na+/H+ antiporter MnhD subunit